MIDKMEDVEQVTKWWVGGRKQWEDSESIRNWILREINPKSDWYLSESSYYKDVIEKP